MKIRVNSDECISCGLCIDLCPKVFEWDEDDMAKAINTTVPEKEEKCARKAMGECPTGAIEEID